MKYNFHITHFLISVPEICKLPNGRMGIEVAFVGYSNSGKSSVINALTCQKKLTKISKTPGSTKLINLFEVKPGIRLIDFPGYGYAKDVNVRKNYWHDIASEYLETRENLKGLVLIMDIRHPIKNLDKKIIESALSMKIPVFTLLSKSDKIPKNTLKVTTQKVIQDMNIKCTTSCIQVAPFSAVKKYGIELLKITLNNWLKC